MGEKFFLQIQIEKWMQKMLGIDQKRFPVHRFLFNLVKWILSLYRAGVAIFKLGGPDIRGPKYLGGPTVCFVLFSPNIGGARALPGHATTPALMKKKIFFKMFFLKYNLYSLNPWSGS